MAMNYTDEEYHQMTLEEVFTKEVKPDLFAVSRVFAEAHKQMTLPEYKTMTLALSRLNWKEQCPDTVYIDKKELASVLGMTSDIDHLSVNLNRAIGEMPKHSFLKFDEKDKGVFMSGNFVRTVAMFKNVVRIRLEEEFLALFGNLTGGKERISQYITMWSEDIFQMNTERAVLFYELLRDNSDTRLLQNEGTVSIKKFKEMFNIPKDGPGSYMREKSGFNRDQFEKRVIDPICAELAKTRMIQLILQPNGKYYEKIKSGNRVIAYKFFWSITEMPRLVTALEDKEIQERQIKNPQIMKVAKDIIKGEKSDKPKKTKKSNGFTDFQQRNYDYDDLEKRLLEKTRRTYDEFAKM